MPLIPYPDVPPYPGVPALVRSANVPPDILIGLGLIQTILASAIQNGSHWGIYDSSGNQLGIISQSNGLAQSIIENIFIGATGPTLSTNAVEFSKETRISDFLVEKGSFANYNKVELPANPVVTLALGGSVTDRATFFNQLQAACISTQLYSVATPEVTYYKYAIERYNYVRRAERGANIRESDRNRHTGEGQCQP